jgi:hypothetical protein
LFIRPDVQKETQAGRVFCFKQEKQFAGLQASRYNWGMKSCLFALVLILVAGTSWSQQTPPPAPTQYYGLGAGFISGTGFLYRWWDGPLGLQINFLPPTGVGLLNLGLNGLWLINDSEFTRFFGYFGGAGWWSTDVSATFGGGIGLELVLGGHIAIDLQGGYGITLSSSGTFAANPSGETSISYRL